MTIDYKWSFPVLEAPEGYAPILESPAPETTTYQSAFEDGVEQDSLGNYITLTEWPVKPEEQWSV